MAQSHADLRIRVDKCLEYCVLEWSADDNSQKLGWDLWIERATSAVRIGYFDADFDQHKENSGLEYFQIH